jgi:hypothetical protein
MLVQICIRLLYPSKLVSSADFRKPTYYRKMLLGFALFYFLTSEAKIFFLKNEKDFQFKLLKQVWKLN